MKQNSFGTKLLMTGACLAVLAYFGAQGFRYLTDPLVTTLAYNYQVEEANELTGYVVREELVLGGEQNGLLRIQRSEGERVSTGGTVAVTYADQAAYDRQDELDVLSARIEQLEFFQESMLGVEATQKLDNQIMQSILDYRTQLTADRLDNAEEHGQELRALVLKRDYTYSGTEGLEEELDSLKEQYDALRGKSSGSVKRISAPESGLFSSVVDGYETVLVPAEVKTLTPSGFSELAAVPSGGVGKLILGDAWYYAAVLPVEEAEELAESGKVSLRFTKSQERDFAVDVWNVGPEENGKCVVTFRGNTYLPQLTLLRHQSAEVIHSTIQGIRVPNEALRVLVQEQDDGTEVRQLGVYSIVGAEARFKPVEVLYSGDEFSLVRGTAQRETLWLRSGDEIIVTARNLYDGKVVL